MRLHLPADTEARRTVRHDLRTPVNSIIGYPELIEEECGPSVPESFRKGLRQVGKLGHRMLELTNTVFGEAPSPLRELPCAALQAECVAPADEALALTQTLIQQATEARLTQARLDLERTALAIQRWRQRLQELVAEYSEHGS